MKRVDVLEKHRLLDGFLPVEEVSVRFETFAGPMSDPVHRQVVRRPDAVGVLLIDDRQRRLVLVRQFRYATHAKGIGWPVEVVAGLIDPGETPEQAARRETREETGYQVDRLETIATVLVSPGYSDERLHLFAAQVHDGHQQGDGGGVDHEGEDIEQVMVPFEQAAAWLADGRITDAKSVIALQWFLLHRPAAR